MPDISHWYLFLSFIHSFTHTSLYVQLSPYFGIGIQAIINTITCSRVMLHEKMTIVQGLDTNQNICYLMISSKNYKSRVTLSLLELWPWTG